ncbi:MAG TPA: GTA-gp10 family protein [Hyphomicrobiaceae bacterium]|jgi:hypothetical protein|nr:GTA-gp10 family protein [Hyphomicrobiaceae bacterium]
MVNTERGEQQLVVGDQTYIMRLTTAAGRELEARTGRMLRDIVRRSMAGSLTDNCWLLWAALQNHHAATVKTLEDVDRLVDEAGGFDGIDAQLQAFMALNAAPDQNGNGQGDSHRPPAAQPTTTGAGSISTPASSV